MEIQVKGFEIEPVFSVGSILSRSFSVLGQNPAVYFGLALLAGLPTAVIDVISAASESSINPGSLIDMVLGLIIQGGIAYAVYQGLEGRTASFADTFSNGMSRIGTLLPLAFLTGLCYLLGILALVIPGLILMCMWAVVVQACVIEELGVIDSLKRSADLTKGYRLQIFGLLIVVGLAAMALAFIAVIIMGMIFADSPVIEALVLSLITVPVVAFNSVMLALVYADLRAVKEGANTSHLLNVFD